jgi:ribonuclease-3
VKAVFPDINADRKKQLRSFCRGTGIKFKNLHLLNLGLVHRSVAGGMRPGGLLSGKDRANNERLEFLGDSILGAVTATLLYRYYGEKNEGDLAKIKSVVVSEAVLCGIACAMRIDSMLVLSRGEELSGGRAKKALLADALEAVIGALYLDSGYKAAFSFVEQFIMPEIKRVTEEGCYRDYKSLLQILSQQKWKQCPVYKCTGSEGEEHLKNFWVVVTVHDKNYGPCAGHRKKAAEQEAARKAYEALTGERAN